jgi:hypothetical protein
MAEETTLYIPVGLPAILGAASLGRSLAASLDPAQPVIAALQRAHGEALARELALGSAGRMAWLLRVELLTFVVQKREPRVHGRGEAVELHVEGSGASGAALPRPLGWPTVALRRRGSARRRGRPRPW